MSVSGTFILTHGLGQTADSWRETAASLDGWGEVFCPELSALLRGQRPEYGVLYRSFAAYCGERTQPLHLCGLSLGGMLALSYAVEHPERVASLVLIAVPAAAPRVLLAVQDAVFCLMPSAAFAELGFSRADFRALCRSAGEVDHRAALPGLAVPALVLVGERDRANRRFARTLAELLPQAEYAEIPGAGHEANTDAPAALGKLLRDFYERKGVFS